MQVLKSKQSKFIRNMLVLAGLIGIVLIGWLLGHILRFSIPELWHPPLQDTDPGTRYVMEYEGIRRIVAVSASGLANLSEGNPPPLAFGALSGACSGTTYFTSLPAKCHTVDGRLVELRDSGPALILELQGK